MRRRSPGPNVPLRAARLATTALALASLAACGGAPPVVAAARRAMHDATHDAAAIDTMPPTAADAEVVARLVRDYLRVRPAGRAPNPYWRRDEQERFHQFDVAGTYTYAARDFRLRYGAYRVEVGAAPPDAEPGTLAATVHFAPRDPRMTMPASVRLFARRERGQWRLGASLPQVTRRWPESRVGGIVFRTQPGIPLDSTRAAAAAGYLDSLVRAFGAEPGDGPADEVLYVLARTSADARRALGIDDPKVVIGGVHFGRNRLIISGGGWQDPYVWHELAHAAFYRVEGAYARHRLASEGAAEWMAWRMAPRAEWGGRAVVRAVVERRPRLGLRDVVRQLRHDDDGDGDRAAEAVFYPSGAWLVGRVHAAAGVRGVRDLLQVRERAPDELLAVARRHLGMSQAQVDSAWRAWSREAGNTVALP